MIAARATISETLFTSYRISDWIAPTKLVYGTLSSVCAILAFTVMLCSYVHKLE